MRHPVTGNYGQVKEVTAQTISQCPHCSQPLQLMETREEWDQVRIAHGVPTGPTMFPADALVRGWWFCHHCDQGGALLWTKHV